MNKNLFNIMCFMYVFVYIKLVMKEILIIYFIDYKGIILFDDVVSGLRFV